MLRPLQIGPRNRRQDGEDPGNPRKEDREEWVVRWEVPRGGRKGRGRGVSGRGGGRKCTASSHRMKTDGLLACGSMEVLGNLEKVRS